MNTREIRLVWEVATTGSVTQAAERVHMTQPSASAAIKVIEERMGFAIFSRENRRLVLTPKGRALLPELSNALTALASLDRLSEELRVDVASSIAIGCIAPAATTVLPFALTALKRSVPKARIVVHTALAVEIAAMVAEQRIDFGLVIGDTLPPEAGVADVALLRLHAVMRPDHVLASHASMAWHQLGQHPYVTLTRRLQVGSLVARRLEESGHAFNPVVEVTQFSSACGFALAGHGLAVLDNLSLPLAQSMGLVAIPIGPNDSVPFRLIWPKGRALSKHADAFALALREALRSGFAPLPG
ncbi:LysR family transcriptional regulator [Comamonadaceae bacterium PP-2]